MGICSYWPHITMQGVVVFFPSFAYCEEVLQGWTNSGLLHQLAAKKRVFVEPRMANLVEATLKDYAECIAGDSKAAQPGGAIMLCVAGGKMSEGINFGDGLGRSALCWTPLDVLVKYILSTSRSEAVLFKKDSDYP